LRVIVEIDCGVSIIGVEVLVAERAVFTLIVLELPSVSVPWIMIGLSCVAVSCADAEPTESKEDSKKICVKEFLCFTNNPLKEAGGQWGFQ
jgi:hypothetical protein